MQIWLKSVSADWAKAAALLSLPDEVNLWRLSGTPATEQPAPGDLLLFRSQDRERMIVGYGRYVATTRHSPGDSWALFNFSNGALTLEDLNRQIEARRGSPSNRPVVLFNNLVADPVFFPPLNPYEMPADLLPRMTGAAPLSAWSRPGRILIRSVRYHAGRSIFLNEPPQARLLGYRTHRLPGTVIRVDERSRRSVLFDLYHRRCAISGQPVSVLLHGAHVWGLDYGGPDELGNMMVLAVEWHGLWDARLVCVDEDHRIGLSDELRIADPHSPFLRFAGQPLRRRHAGPPYPEEANLAWQRRFFRGPAYRPSLVSDQDASTTSSTQSRKSEQF